MAFIVQFSSIVRQLQSHLHTFSQAIVCGYGDICDKNEDQKRQKKDTKYSCDDILISISNLPLNQLVRIASDLFK